MVEKVLEKYKMHINRKNQNEASFVAVLKTSKGFVFVSFFSQNS